MRIIQTAQNLQFVEPLETLNETSLARAVRDAIINEQIAIQQYEVIADSTTNNRVKSVLKDIANEEKVHVGELTQLLSELDKEDQDLLEEGAKEVVE